MTKECEMSEDRPEQKKDEPKIIVDDDWKAQAQAEKERLSEEVEEAKGDAGEAGRGEIPPASFTTLVSSLVAQSFMALGGMQDPKTKKRYVDLALAKHHIDMLSVLEDKTSGNLTEEEKKLLDQALYESRMQYVSVAQQVSKAT
jgi:hypothetical protein